MLKSILMGHSATPVVLSIVHVLLQYRSVWHTALHMPKRGRRGRYHEQEGERCDMADEWPFSYLDDVVDVLLTRVPELRPVYQQLIDDEGPPVRPYGFFDRSARFAQQLAARSPNNPAMEDML